MLRVNELNAEFRPWVCLLISQETSEAAESRAGGPRCLPLSVVIPPKNSINETKRDLYARYQICTRQWQQMDCDEIFHRFTRRSSAAA
jgi:hypothetical protein